MKKIKTGILIYLITLITLLTLAFFYGFYIYKTHNNANQIVEIIIGVIVFLVLGFLYGNAIHKKGILVGMIVGIAHLGLVLITTLIVNKEFIFNGFSYSAYFLTTIIGAILGTNFKKII